MKMNRSVVFNAPIPYKPDTVSALHLSAQSRRCKSGH